MGNGLILSLGAWAWLVGGLVLMAIELIAPGTVLLWFGLAALVTGAIALSTGIVWQGQVAIFALLSVAALFAWRALRRRLGEGDPPRDVSDRAGGHVGRRFVLAEPIVHGSGRIRIDDSIWRIEGPDLPAGAEIEVERVDGAILRVRGVG